MEDIQKSPENSDNSPKDNMELLRDSLSDIDSIPDVIELNDGEIPEENMHPHPQPNEDEALENTQEFSENDGKPKKRRKGNDARARIDRLSREKEMLRQELYKANDLLQRQAQQAAIEKQAFAQNADMNYENALNSQLVLAKQQLLLAENEENIEAKVHLQDRIADIRSQMRQMEFERKQLSFQEDVRAPVVYDPTLLEDNYYDESQGNQNEAFNSWLDDNEWFNPQSRIFNASLAEEAKNIAEDLSAKLTLHRRTDIIGTDAFYNTVTQALNERHGITPEQEQEPRYMERTPQMPRGQYPQKQQYTQQRPPVGTRGAMNQDNQHMYNADASGNGNYSRPLYLTREQSEFASQIADVMGVSEAQAKKIYALRAQERQSRR